MKESKTERKVKKIFDNFFEDNWDEPKKKKKRKKKEKEPKFDFLWHLVNVANISPTIAKDWMQVRKEKKAVNTATAFNFLYNELDKIREKYGITNNDAIKICVIRCWMGCKVSYFETINFADYDITPSLPQQLQLQPQYQNPTQTPYYYGRNQSRHPETFVRTFTEKDQQNQVF